jgi:NAD(P) transhydrogenase subunit beta
MTPGLLTISYLIAAVFFILSLSGLASPKTARRGNLLGIAGMIIAVAATLLSPDMANFKWIVIALLIGGSIGTIIAIKINMTNLPQLIAAFHSLVGMAAVLVAAAALYSPESFGLGQFGHIRSSSLIEMSLGTIVGAITFSGSVIAFAKLQGIMSGTPIVFRGQKIANALIALLTIAVCIYFIITGQSQYFWLMAALALLFGVMGIIPIGGADMPVVISMLNSFSGWAASGIGFTLSNHLLIITGALVGSSGAILSYIMCKGMNRKLIDVLLGGFGTEGGTVKTEQAKKPVHSGSAEDAAYLLDNISSIIIVPGYGMAVAHAQHAIKELYDILKKKNISVKFAIHPVAGRMPGHMNVLLAEANVPYEDVLELENINQDFTATDVSLVIGANDITNPIARTDRTSSIYGMPILNVDKSGKVLFIKRSLASGYAGIDNELFYRDNTMMLFGDAKKVVDDILKSISLN